jgi:hypothetical protein
MIMQKEKTPYQNEVGKGGKVKFLSYMTELFLCSKYYHNMVSISSCTQKV